MEKKYLIIVHRNDESKNNIIVCNDHQDAENTHRHWFDLMNQQNPNKPYGHHNGELLLNKNRNGYIIAVELAEVKTISMLKREE